jgi:hypothetical protein
MTDFQGTSPDHVLAVHLASDPNYWVGQIISPNGVLVL